MKNIVKFQIIKPNGKVTIDAYNPDFKFMELSEILNSFIPYTKLFEEITIKNFTTISEELLNRLTNQFLHGATIRFDIPSRKFCKEYSLGHKAPSFYAYKWKPLDLTAPVPKSLAEFEFVYNGVKTTYLNALKTLTSTRYLPTEIWNALDVYSQQQIDKCKEFNKGEYACAEQWFKDLMHDCMSNNIKMFSPNKKTYFEVIAEVNFDKQCELHKLKQGLRTLNEQELYFLHKYAPAYGIDIPMFRWKINTRKTDHGYTQEPEICPAMSTYDWTKVIYDRRNDNNLPAFVRQGLSVRECPNDKLLRDAYFQLKWLIKHMKDSALMPGWKRCPVCHKLYRESEGCECGACLPIEFVNADNMFYANSESYEDYDSTHNYYNELQDFDFVLEDLDE